jgi:hypothetical protein
VPARLRILGGDFYIGALMWWLRAGAKTAPADETSARCELGADWSPPAEGVFAVEVGYGGGPTGLNQGWSLAGFVVVGPQVLGRQPGEACDAAAVCQSAGGWTCTCLGGSCACEAPDDDLP